MNLFFLIFTLLFCGVILPTNAFANSCIFEEHKHLYKAENAKDNAYRDYIEQRTVIYVIATGFGPSRPYFESKSKLNGCLLEEYWEKQVVLWTGADEVGSCKNRGEAVDEATKYASEYNKKLITLLKENNHKCFK